MDNYAEWYQLILDSGCTAREDRENNQTLAERSGVVVGVYDHDLRCGSFTEDVGEFDDKEEWLRSLGDKITVDQSDEDTTVVTDEDGKVVGVFVGGSGVKIKEAVGTRPDWMPKGVYDVVMDEYNTGAKPQHLWRLATTLLADRGVKLDVAMVSQLRWMCDPEGGDPLHQTESAGALSHYSPKNKTAMESAMEKMAEKLQVDKGSLYYSWTLDPAYEPESELEDTDDKEFALGIDTNRPRREQREQMQAAYELSDEEMDELLACERWFYEAMVGVI